MGPFATLTSVRGAKSAPGDGDAEPYGDAPTESMGEEGGSRVRRFRLHVAEGPARGESWESSSDRCSIGSHRSNDLVIDDPTVSRFHCEILLDLRGARVRDLDSRNGTWLDGVATVESYLRDGSVIRLGRSSFRFELGEQTNRLQLSERDSFGALVGISPAMRAAFALLERAAGSEATVLVQGETGTGKELAAEGIHAASARARRPFVVIDGSAVPEHLLESELFGHERGAFTGADRERAGAFESAHGGTVFLDEIGELPIELQPKLLRVLESREVRRIGSQRPIAVDVRLVAATNRDLRAEVNAGRFRADLYFRLAVLKVTLPPLRSRPEDLPMLVERLCQQFGADEAMTDELTAPEFISKLRHWAWPGNVRELRNYVQRCLVLREPPPLSHDERVDEGGIPVDCSLPYERARANAVAGFERRYVMGLLRQAGGNVSRAAREAGIDRVYFHRLMRRHGVRASSE